MSINQTDNELIEIRYLPELHFLSVQFKLNLQVFTTALRGQDSAYFAPAPLWHPIFVREMMWIF